METLHEDYRELIVMQRENRYVVIKRSDIEKHLPDDMKRQLDFILKKITYKRALEKKDPLQCVVVEHDSSVYESTWDEIEAEIYSCENCHGSVDGSV